MSGWNPPLSGSACGSPLTAKEFILRSNNSWGHRHIYTEPDISDRPKWWLDWLDRTLYDKRVHP